MINMRTLIAKKIIKKFKGLTMIEVLASIIVLSLVILALISTAYYIFASYEEISIKGIIRRKVDEYYHSHIFTKYYLYENYLGDIDSISEFNPTVSNINVAFDSSTSTNGTATVTTVSKKDELYKRLNINNNNNNNNIGINLPSLLKDMINAFNNDEWIKSQGITITSLSATLLATIGFYRIDTLQRKIHIAYTLDKIRIDFNFQKRNKHQFRMSFEYYLVNNMKSSSSYGSPVSTTTTWQTLANGTNVFRTR
ncbi:MAG: hypothetical protein ACP5O4_05450 [bacterium]